MANTHCKSCIFAKPSDSQSPCEFDIIDIVKNEKELSVIDNYFYIKEYKCKYGLSNSSYKENNEFKNLNIKNYIVEKSKIVYYLIVDCRKFDNSKIISKIHQIKNLDIKPKLVSFIISSQDQKSKDVISIIKKELNNSCIDWKIHSFLNDAKFNDAINISAETTFQNIENLQFLILDDGTDASEINDIINHLQYSWVVCQNGAYCYMKNKNSLHLVSIHISLYKAIGVTTDKNIIDILQNIPNLDIGSYEIEKSK